MGLHRYATASNELARELAESLTTEEITELARVLCDAGFQKWQHFCEINHDEICRYVEATPSLRKKKKDWVDPKGRPPLVLAAITHCRRAHALLRFYADHEAELAPGGSYRDTTALAGTLFWQLWGIEIQEWPEEFAAVCPSPFE